jgi:hypothetical protein
LRGEREKNETVVERDKETEKRDKETETKSLNKRKVGTEREWE